MDIMMIRGFERILAVVIGGIAIYLGYRLFTLVADQRDASGNIRLPGIGVYLTRVGPGAFFALFGTIIVGMSFHYSVKMDNTYGDDVMSSYSAFGGGNATAPEQLSDDANLMDTDFLTNNLPRMLRADLPAAGRDELDRVLKRVKLQLVEQTWEDEWGDFKEMKAWVAQGAPRPAPEKLIEVADFFPPE